MTPVAVSDPVRVAVFDLDGTLTRHDTLVHFLLFCLRRNPAALARLWRLPFTLVRYALGLSDRGRLKASLVRQVLGAATAAQIGQWAVAFCIERLPGLLLPLALDALDRHRRAGDRLVLMSASVDLYVPQIAARLGFHETVCTGVSWTAGRLDGTLTTENRRGAEKSRCLRQLQARFPAATFAAYGNASSDIEHLLLADQPTLVNANQAARRSAARSGLPCEDWRGETIRGSGRS